MIHLQENVNFKGCTLIFPSVSVGNAGQLAVDLLVTKIKPQKVGLIWHSAIIPMVGGDPYSLNETALTTSAELFYSEQWKLVIFQIRSPIMQETSQDFVDKLTEWIKENCIDKIVILSGIFDYTRNDNEMAGPSVKFVVSRAFSEKSNILQRLEDQTATSDYQTHSVICDGSEESKKISMYGGGISWKFFNACNVGGIPAVVLMKYCSEGDNIPDAVLLCTHLNTLLNLVPSDCNWESPPSWTGRAIENLNSMAHEHKQMYGLWSQLNSIHTAYIPQNNTCARSQFYRIAKRLTLTHNHMVKAPLISEACAGQTKYNFIHPHNGISKMDGDQILYIQPVEPPSQKRTFSVSTNTGQTTQKYKRKNDEFRCPDYFEILGSISDLMN